MNINNNSNHNNSNSNSSSCRSIVCIHLPQEFTCITGCSRAQLVLVKACSVHTMQLAKADDCSARV